MGKFPRWISLANSSHVYQVLGREEEARAYMAEAININPSFSVEVFTAINPYENPAHLQMELDALRKAGMPEKAPGAVQEKPSIAVLPFIDISPEKDQGYFVDGLSEEILNSLCQIPDLTVIARTSSFSFKGTNKKIQEIASELGVKHILEGSVRKAGNALRITAQLIRAADDSHIWSETYDRELKDIFRIQEDIANNVADKLKLTIEALWVLGGTESVDAYEKYLVSRGKYAEGDTKSAMELIDAAIDIDPEFALAWAFKGNMHVIETFSGSPTKSIVESDACIEAAHKAIELEPNLADGYITLASMKMLKSEWLEAEINFRKALELYGESLSGNHSMIIPFYISVGKFKKAHKLLEKMRKNDPLDQNFPAWYYFIYGLLGNRQRADEEYQNRNQTMLKGDSDWHDDAISFVRIGSGDVLSSDEIVSSDPIYDTVKKYFESSKLGIEELRRIYDSDNKLSSANLSRLSIMAAYFSAPEFSLDALKKGAIISSDLVPCWVPVMKEVRQLPRFKEFVREIGIVDYWKEYGWPDLCRPVGDDDFVCD